MLEMRVVAWNEAWNEEKQKLFFSNRHSPVAGTHRSEGGHAVYTARRTIIVEFTFALSGNCCANLIIDFDNNGLC